MNWRERYRETGVVVRKELLVLRRSRAVVPGIALFSLVVTYIVWIASFPSLVTPGYLVGWNTAAGQPDPTGAVIFWLGRSFSLVLPFVAVACCFGAVAGEHESDTIRTLQSLPVSRSAVVSGKVIARLVTVGVIMSGGLLVGGGVAWFRFGTLDGGSYVAFSGASILYGIVLGVITVAVSAFVSTRLRAIAFSLGPFLLLGMFGPDRGLSPAGRSVLLVQPYQILVADAHDQLFAVPRLEYAVEVLDEQAILDALEAGNLAETAPWYLSDVGAIAAMLGWVVVFVSIAVIRHNRRDL